MKNLSASEKIGITLILISLITIALNVFEIEQNVSTYGSYLASIGAVFLYLGWAKRKKASKEK